MADVPARQLQFFPHAKPLLSIFGQQFFRSIPRAPGVYLMTGKAARVLYVGQSANLRQRLATYKNCNPNQLPRRIIRLIHQVQSISFEVCDSARHARLRENELLRLHHPKFNVVNVYPRAYPFIGLQFTSEELTLWLTTEQHPQTATRRKGSNVFGAFKGVSRDAFQALVRSLWAAMHQPASLAAFPCGLLSATRRRRFTFRALPAADLAMAANLLRRYLEGGSLDLLDWLQQSLFKDATLPFQRQLHTADIAILADFFERGPRRNYHLRQQHRLDEPLILQDKLDDLIVSGASQAFKEGCPFGERPLR